MTITAKNFEQYYDEDHTYPFFETEDAVIFGYGHPDKSWAADQVRAYYEHVAGEDIDISADEVSHRWAIEVDAPFAPGDEPGGFSLGDYDQAGKPVPHTEETPGAFPIWTVFL